MNSSGFPSDGDYGNAFMKLSTSGGLSVADYFEMANQSSENGSDTDLGSGGALVLPDLTDGSGNTVHLAVGAGKDAIIYVVNRDSMGKFTSTNSGIYQQISGQLPGKVFSMPAYFNGTLYYGAVGGPIQAFPISNAKLSTNATVHTANNFPCPRTTPSISANGTSNGIVWAVENNTPAVLHAYDATTLNELYNSNQASGARDQFGNGNKFMTPTIVNGKVFVGPNGVAVSDYSRRSMNQMIVTIFIDRPARTTSGQAGEGTASLGFRDRFPAQFQRLSVSPFDCRPKRTRRVLLQLATCQPVPEKFQPKEDDLRENLNIGQIKVEVLHKIARAAPIVILEIGTVIRSISSGASSF